MSSGKRRDDFVLDDLLELGKEMGIRRNGKVVVSRLVEAMNSWESHANVAGAWTAKVETTTG